jgi:large subunit ribosomal protein L3
MDKKPQLAVHCGIFCKETMKYILGTKQHMTQVFTDDGNAHPATVVSAGPLVVMQLKNAEKDGYVATQVGFGTRNKKNIAKPQQGHFKSLGDFRYVREFRTDHDETTERNVGDTIDVSTFAVGDFVTVSAISKAKGFQGVVKRHGFAGGPRTHGTKTTERSPGSIGAQGPQRVLKGMRMGGRMGGDRVTVKNLTVLQVLPKENLLIIKGAIPGRRGTLVEIRSV